MENPNINNIPKPENMVPDTELHKVAPFTVDPHIANLEALYEKVEQEEVKDKKRLNSTILVVFAIVIIIITLFTLSYMNGSRVVGN
ncbi:MAG: hypothetical protein WCO35_01035 [Candidatus Nomurabacteria bacterium]